MKKCFYVAILLISVVCFGQNFPGRSIQLLNGKELKVLPKEERSQKYGYSGFYKDDKLKKAYECCDSYNAKYSSLVGKVFKVVSYEPYKNSIGTEKFKIILENKETGIIYFDYDPSFDHDYPFEVIGGLQIPEDFYCQEITETNDKFTGDKRFNTEYSEGVSFVKVVKNNVTKIYITINEQGSTLNVGKKGLILLLSNSKKIEKPEASITAEVNKYGGYTYSTFVELTKEDLQLLSENVITDNRLYIYDGTIKNGNKLKEYVKCLIK